MLVRAHAHHLIFPMIPEIDRLQFGPDLDIWADSRIGAGTPARAENQDNVLLIDAEGRALFLRNERWTAHMVRHWPHGHVRLAVLDGMGGHGHGRQAAEAVVAGLLTIPACTTLAELAHHLDVLHTALQRHFRDESHSDASGRPGTTLTLLELRPGQAPLLYHVGDSRLYEITPEQITPLTIDHVPATTFAMAGLLDELQWWQQVHGEHRTQISQAFILGNALANPTVLSDPLFELSPLNLPPFLYRLGDRRALEVRPDALYLLATDGFWACAAPFDWVSQWPQLLERTGQDARAALGALFSRMTQHPPQNLYSDNISAIAVRFSAPLASTCNDEDHSDRK